MSDHLSKRQKFFLGHLGLSLSLAVIILMWVFFCWYPSPLAQAVGAGISGLAAYQGYKDLTGGN